MKFFLDEDLPPGVAVICRNQGLDVQSVHETGRQGLSDQEQLEYAASQDRVLVTRNRNDFIELTRRAFQTGSPHGGVLIVTRSLPNRRAEQLASALIHWTEVFGDHPSAGTLDFLSRGT